MADDQHYDVIIIGTGAGGGTLGHRIATNGGKVLWLERGSFLPRERDNWSSEAVFVRGKYLAPEQWYDRHGREFQPEVNYYVGGTPSSTARPCSGSARRTSASSRTTAGSPRPGRSPTTTWSRTTRRRSTCTWCTATTARTPPRGTRARRTPFRRCRTNRGSSS